MGHEQVVSFSELGMVPVAFLLALRLPFFNQLTDHRHELTRLVQLEQAMTVPVSICEEDWLLHE